MISTHKKKKIALIGYRLSGGGSDKVMANLSIFFEQQGSEVDIIIVLDEVGFPYSGKLVNLGLLKNKTNGVFNKIKRLKALNTYLRQNKFDFIIDFRFRTKIIQELILSRFIYNTKTIFTVHSFLIDHYMPNNSWLTRLIYNHCLANVAITDEMKTLIEEKHQLQNVVKIHNPVYLEEIVKKQNEKIDLEFDFIIAVGQYENEIKQFDQLISSYAKSDLSQKNIHLVIVGNGDESKLKKAILENNISEFVHLLGYQNNPFKYLRKAKFLVLSSKNEGFPNVILEALACEIPVVSFDCDFGPRDMIADFENGILVENQNWEKLTEALNLLISDDALRQKLKQNTLKSIEPFLLEKIGKQWLDLLEVH
ncbi:glycosyltransferase [Flavobacterium daemonense]|uniref:glycosyltransferase n=1 Tax=Flavobacterium daemonense TaxID=1393049 RepID=UPI001184FBDE|nr:glycosyltransferase [Flavobacterium daemonense]KAF2335141.1 glycosyltransferase family 4 protein [Flavobacterium daemonense]